MWETMKSIVFVLATVMAALIFQARATPEYPSDLNPSETSIESDLSQFDFSYTISIDS